MIAPLCVQCGERRARRDGRGGQDFYQKCGHCLQGWDNPEKYEEHKNRVMVRYKEKVAWLRERKAMTGCQSCGYDRCVEALEFHHADPASKEAKLSGQGLANLGTKRMKAEVEKCLVVCANCHREHHAGLLELNL